MQDGAIFSETTNQLNRRSWKLWLMLDKFPTDDADDTPKAQQARHFARRHFPPRPWSNHSNIVVAPLDALDKLCDLLESEDIDDESRDSSPTIEPVDDPYDVLAQRAVDGGGALSSDKSNEFFRQCASDPGGRGEQCRNRYQHSTALNAVGCTLTLSSGDLVVLHPDIYHRTQDLAIERIALQLDAW